MTDSQGSVISRRVPKALSLAIVVFLFVFLAVPVGVLLLREPIINSDPIRTEITEVLRRLTGRQVTLEGEIVVGDFPWITVIVGPGSFGNPEGFGGPPLLRWQQLSFKIHYSTIYEPEPLLGPIIIDGLVAEPRVDKSGRDNFTGIGPLENSGPPEAALAIPKIELRGARLHYTDETVSASSMATLEDLNLSIDDFRRGSGPIESTRFQISQVKLASRMRWSSGTGPTLDGALETRITNLRARIPEQDPLSLDVERVEVGLGALRSVLRNVVVTPQLTKAEFGIESAPIDALARALGFTPPFRSRPDLFQLRNFSASLSYRDDVFSVDRLDLQIDNTQVSGNVRLEDPIRLAIEVNQVDFEPYAAAIDGGGGYDPEAPLIFPGKLLQDLPLDGRIRFGKISARGANLIGVSLMLKSRPRAAPKPR